MCLPSDALLQHLPSYLGFSYLGRGVSLHGCSSKAQPLLLTLDEGYLLTAALPGLQCGIDPLGPPAPAQPRLLGRGVAPPGCRPWPRAWGMGYLLPAAAPDFGRGVTPLIAAPGLGRGVTPLVATPDLGCRVTPLVAPPDLRCRVAPLGRSCTVAAWHSQLLPLTSDVG